jgi:hypothetical protein
MTYIWLDGQLFNIDAIPIVKSRGPFITFQPCASGDSSFLAQQHTPEANTDFASGMAQALCLAKKYGIPLNDFNPGNWSYNPRTKIVYLFDLAPNGESNPISELFEYYILSQLERLITGPAMLERLAVKNRPPELLSVDISPIAMLLRFIMEFSRNDPDLQGLFQEASTFSTAGQVPYMTRLLNTLVYRNPDAAPMIQGFEEVERAANASFFKPLQQRRKSDLRIPPETKSASANQLLITLQQIIRESSNLAGRILEPDIIKPHMTKLAGAEFGEFIGNVDPIIFVIWLSTKIPTREGYAHEARELFPHLVRHTLRDKLHESMFDVPIGEQSPEWHQFLGIFPEPLTVA